MRDGFRGGLTTWIRSRHVAHLGPVTLALAVAVATYHRALGTFFAQDDITFLSRAAGVELAGTPFRPLSTGLAFRLQYLAFGLDARPYHVVSLLLHLVNVVGAYALTYTVCRRRAAATLAAILFGSSSIAFTPLHWTSGISDLLATTFLIGATLIHLHSMADRSSRRWAAAGVALLAMLSKETAVMWVVMLGVAERLLHRQRPALRSLVPGIVITGGFLLFLGVTRGRDVLGDAGAYAMSTRPLSILLNGLTYVRWTVELWNPIRDGVAQWNPGAWRVALPALAIAAAVFSRSQGEVRAGIAFGAAWWLAFLAPVLPLLHHTYLYYLYLPAIGGALAGGAAVQGLLIRWPSILTRGGVTVGVAALVLVEMRNVRMRETSTRDALPIDRTIREAMLLEHALPALREARLPSGTNVLFVSPAMRGRFDLMTGAPTRSEDVPVRRSYLPLEAAMRGGETLNLFVPQVTYAGFARTIPESLEDAECFHFDQRGQLERWGRGQHALMRQAEALMADRRWAAAESTFRRVRAMGDTLPAAIAGEARASARAAEERAPR